MQSWESQSSVGREPCARGEGIRVTYDADMHQVRRDDVFNSVHKYVTHALDGDRWAYVRSDIADPTWLQSTGPSVYDSFLSFCLIADPT